MNDSPAMPMPVPPEPVPWRPATPSIHRQLLISVTPQWLIQSTAQRRLALKHFDAALPPAYWRATPEQRQCLHDCFVQSFTTQTAVDQTLSALQGVEDFARPLLANALKEQYGVTLAPKVATWLSLRKSLLVSDFKIEARTYDFLKLDLLQAALHNFEASECEEGAFHPSSGFRWKVTSSRASSTDSLLPVRLGRLKVHEFLGLCRSLDLGAKYQAYISDFFSTVDTTLREQFIASQKAAMRAAAELARLCQDITEDDYTLVLSVINGERSPQMEGQPVWICDLALMGLRMTGCVLFLAFDDAHLDSPILYIPHDPYHPLKRYDDHAQLLATLKRRFTTPGSPTERITGPTAYQHFFSQFVDYADRPHYFSQFTQDAPDATLRERIGSNFPGIGQLYELLSKLTPLRLKGFPPLPLAPQVANPDPSLAPRALAFKGQVFGSDKIDLWTYLYERHRHKCITDAASHAVPTANVDARVRKQKLALLLNIEMFALNAVAGFVPVLGEITMAMMAGQLLKEAFEATQEWSEGDRKAARAHLIDLAQNLALLGLTAGAGVALRRLKPEPVIEALEPVKLADGQVRLWRPDLVSYKKDITLVPASRPNALGQYEVDGQLHVRLDNALYEKTFDPQLDKWRIKHPRDPLAYRPILEHNRAGAWRHSHERPLAWDRLTLLRRLGPITDGFSDETLRGIGDVSGVSDDVLRKVHLDGLPVPAVLADTLERFRVDQDVGDLIGRLRRGAGLERHHEHALPLAVQMPGWPLGRALEVFEDVVFVGAAREAARLGEDEAQRLLGTPGRGGQPGIPVTEEWVDGRWEPAGHSIRYGAPAPEHDSRPSVKISRLDLQQGRLAQVVLEGLNEQEIRGLLGSTSSWGGTPGAQVFNERLADYARQRQSALFDALLRGTGRPLIQTGPLQRRFPSLSRRAQDELLNTASPQELEHLHDHGRVSERLDLRARISVQQGRLSRALSGLYRDGLASADGDRVTLHCLERLPGWPQGLRLEVRIESIQGPLLDSIGDEHAPLRRYLVKRGDSFQAQDVAGNLLNSTPAQGCNLLQAIVDALPDPARRLLASDGVGLQQALAAYARRHRDMIGHDILKLRAPRSRPAVRLPSGRLGYELSGRGGPFADDARLIAHVRSVYPNISEAEAQERVWARRRDGESTQQIWRLFANRRRELMTLRTTLDQWAGADEQRMRSMGDVIDCWRLGCDRGQVPHATLSLRGEQALPELQADFSHVRSLNLSGARLLAQDAAGLLQPFPRVQHLELYVLPGHLGAVAERLANFQGITGLSLTGPLLSYSPEVLLALNRMVWLEQLSLAGSLENLDVSGLTALRRLTVSGTLQTWPTGLQALEHLEFLDLARTQLHSVPAEMFVGHQRLWRGLHMNWSAYEPEDFMRVYEYLHDNPAHLVDEQRLVQAYCEGALGRLRPGAQAFVDNVLAGFRTQGLTSRQRLERVGAVQEEYRRLIGELEQWSDRDSSIGRVEVERQVASERLMECWRQGLAQRLVGAAPVAGALDLSGANLIDFPQVPASGFAHVRSLNLDDIGVSLEGINGWLGHFPQLDTLSLARNNLTELPVALLGHSSLRHLDLSHNWLVMTPAIQARLSRLSGLSSLRLQYNPISRLDVSGLHQLQILDLSHSAISDWPQGVLELEALQRLDLSHSAVTAIPDAVLSGHERLLSVTHLRGCRLSLMARADARMYARRYGAQSPSGPLETPLGIPRELLAQGQTGGEPEYFSEDMLRRPDLLVALATVTGANAVPLALAARLQRLAPALDDLQATARIAELRASGLDTRQVEARLDEWEGQYGQWVAVLNEWIDVHGYLDGGWISALDRRRAADRLLESWRHTLRPTPPIAGLNGVGVLDFSGLSLGDMPRVPMHFTHVTELNLSRVRLTAQGSNEFLRAFTHVQTLTLSHNGLHALPEAIAEFHALRRLDLSENVLSELDLRGQVRLDALYLQNNLLDEWPMGLFELPRLRTLDLHDNWIETLPPTAFEPQHRQLMAGTNLAGNRLGQQSCEDLQAYLAHTGNGLGFTDEQLENMIRGHRDRDERGAFDSPDYSLSHPDVEAPQIQKARWFGGTPPSSPRHRLWDDLSAQEGSSDFFYTLSQLRNTDDFLEAPAELTQRVWSVLEAIGSNPAMRRDLFARATAMMPEVTCGDGRILMFNEFERRVLEFDALRMAEHGQDGAALLKFARGMIRLEAVEGIAQAISESRPDIDPAEIRLALRIGLAQRLELPRQPSGMLYSELSEITQADLDRAYTAVLERENTPGFDERLVGLEYWLNYLKKKYATDFSALARELERKTDSLDARYPDDGSDYLREYAVLGTWSKEQRVALAIRLTRQERAELRL
ncbi:leucine-rich repeat-containing protein [Pseudomonas fluorescens]|uniref:RING-type E3 ubiquitin transferase n=1 Tax=Pseudomonas fluorescens TaxID=294 RepID=A0A379IEH7_PSEFL|nr:NEL-type E3 ubiquitin ligase domain-containing protein [Pseudomonas fluorescens]SUD31192.1 leucine-rich repeat-containing protein [Pseudomonas fluorescens]